LLTIAEALAIKNPKGIIDVQGLIPRWQEFATGLMIPDHIIHSIEKDFITL